MDIFFVGNPLSSKYGDFDMKKILTGIVILAAATSLMTGCSTNSQKENTAVGAVGGAALGGLGAAAFHGNPVAIGLSAVAGAVIGGAIGNKMDSTDNTAVYHAMNDNNTNARAVWVNPHTGVKYYITPTSDVDANGCRTYRAKAVIHGKKHVSYGTMCRQSNGTWVLAK
jgi:surface antigen